MGSPDNHCDYSYHLSDQSDNPVKVELSCGWGFDKFEAGTTRTANKSNLCNFNLLENPIK